MKYIFAGFLFLFAISGLQSQSVSDVTLKNLEAGKIRSSKIKTISITDYRYVNDGSGLLADSGYKSFYSAYDETGRITEHKKFHVFTDLTIKELYMYDKHGNITVNTRYNSKDDRIETIYYKYNKKGLLKTQQHEAYYNSVRTGVYFTILAGIAEDNLFIELQKDLEIEPLLETYSVVVNITDPEELNQYIVIGDESDPSSLRFSWQQLSMESQRGLLNYSGPNRKEHTYISRFISEVRYKYDKNGNRTSRRVYNTAGDLTERETWRYDSDGKKTGYAKYGENKKLRSSESYTYDKMGRLSESTGLEPGGGISGKLEYIYDINGLISEKRWHNSSGEISGAYKYLYYDNGLISREIKFSLYGEKESVLEYIYNDMGNIKEIVKYNSDDEKVTLRLYDYEYY